MGHSTGSDCEGIDRELPRLSKLLTSVYEETSDDKNTYDGSQSDRMLDKLSSGLHLSKIWINVNVP